MSGRSAFLALDHFWRAQQARTDSVRCKRPVAPITGQLGLKVAGTPKWSVRWVTQRISSLARHAVAIAWVSQSRGGDLQAGGTGMRLRGSVGPGARGCVILC